MTSTPRPLPQATSASRPFWQAAAGGKLLLQQCADCGRRHAMGRLFCTGCLSENLQWMPSSGLGRIYTYTVNGRASHPALKERLPMAVAVVTLDEGVRLMGEVVNPAGIGIGAAVRVVFEPVSDELALPRFELLPA
jgi:uncharacterized OB-fold protein